MFTFHLPSCKADQSLLITEWKHFKTCLRTRDWVMDIVNIKLNSNMGFPLTENAGGLRWINSLIIRFNLEVKYCFQRTILNADLCCPNIEGILLSEGQTN